MKQAFYLVIALFVLSCNQPEDKPEERLVTQLLPQPAQLELSVKSALTEILKKNFETSGNKIDSIQVTGMEIIKISRKDYFIDERNSQIKNFDSYLKYIEKFKNTSSPVYKHADIPNSKIKHATVMEYLDRMIKQAPSDKVLYKVAYYLKADTRNINYTQLQTTYLDENLKQITSDYSHLKSLK